MAQGGCKCSRCGAALEVEIPQGVNVERNPELKDKIKDGSLFLRECPYCGTVNLVRGEMLYHDPEAKLMVWLLPEGAVDEGRIRAVESQLEPLEGYILRRVADEGSLIEKVNIFDAGLDDRVMELCKYITRMELGEKGEELGTEPMRFFRMDGADGILTLVYPKDGKMHGAEIGFNVYEDCRGILQRNPEVTAAPGFAVVDEGWVRRFFR